MPFSTVKLLPGVKTEPTPTLNEAGISASNLIRFFGGLPQKLGGWTAYYPRSFASIPRALAAWEDLNSVDHLGVGCDASVSVITAGSLQDISPRYLVHNSPVNFSTVAGSDIVTILDPGSNASFFDVIFLATPVSVGGVILYGSYSIFQAQTPDQYEIEAGQVAISTVNNGGVVPVYTSAVGTSSILVALPDHGYSVGSTYAAPVPATVGGVTVSGLLPVTAVSTPDVFGLNLPGPATSTATVALNGGNVQIIYWITVSDVPEGTGYGIGGYGEGGYGAGSYSPSPTPGGVSLGAENFSMFNWGSTLITVPVGYGVFTWSPTSGLLGCQLIAGAPTACTGAFLAMPEQQIVVYGASVLGVLDPMLVAWCDNGDYTDWIASVSNQAGTYRLTRGSRIVGGLQGPQQALLWTDLGIWAMQYIGYPLVYGFNEVAQGCGLIAQEAAGVLGGSVFWMSQKGFFSYANGAVTPIVCDVWDAILQDINQAQIAKIRAAPNSQFNEISWFFASDGQTENNRYVKYNVLSGVWDYGNMLRSCWIDQNALGPPLAAGRVYNDYLQNINNGYTIFQHETGPDDNNSAMDSWFQTGFFMLSDGEDKVFVDYVIPDFKYGFFPGNTGADVHLTFYVADFPEETPNVFGPYTVKSTSQGFSVRFRGRFVAIRGGSGDLGSFYRLGGVKFRFAADGRN